MSKKIFGYLSNSYISKIDFPLIVIKETFFLLTHNHLRTGNQKHQYYYSRPKIVVKGTESCG